MTEVKSGPADWVQELLHTRIKYILEHDFKYPELESGNGSVLKNDAESLAIEIRDCGLAEIYRWFQCVPAHTDTVKSEMLEYLYEAKKARLQRCIGPDHSVDLLAAADIMNVSAEAFVMGKPMSLEAEKMIVADALRGTTMARRGCKKFRRRVLFANMQAFVVKNLSFLQLHHMIDDLVFSTTSDYEVVHLMIGQDTSPYITVLSAFSDGSMKTANIFGHPFDNMLYPYEFVKWGSQQLLYILTSVNHEVNKKLIHYFNANFPMQRDWAQVLEEYCSSDPASLRNRNAFGQCIPKSQTATDTG